MYATSLRLPDDIGQRLAELAERTGRSRTFYILEAIREHLDDLEDLYLAEATLERIRRGEERVYTSEEVERLLEMEDYVHGNGQKSIVDAGQAGGQAHQKLS